MDKANIRIYSKDHINDTMVDVFLFFHLRSFLEFIKHERIHRQMIL